MKTVVPHYYRSFKCIADKCHHSCCVGWQIGIDEDTLERYRTLEGEMGEIIRDSIEWSDAPHFKLCDDDRCPHLRENGLCRIISRLGEDALCEICDRHPRFFNYYEDRVEIGLGLCCEEACRLVLEEREPFVLVSEGTGEDTDEESAIFAERDSIIHRIFRENGTFNEKVQRLLDEYDAELIETSAEEWAMFYQTLERLDEDWTGMLNKLGSFYDVAIDEIERWEWDSQLQNIFAYFIYRYTPRALEEEGFSTVLKLAAHCAFIIRAVAVVCDCSLAEVLRMYSSEVEYSDENFDDLYFELSI